MGELWSQWISSNYNADENADFFREEISPLHIAQEKG